MGRFGIKITKSQQRKDELSGRTKKGKLPVSQYAYENYMLLDIAAMAANDVGFRTAYSSFFLVCKYLDTRPDVSVHNHITTRIPVQGHTGSAIKFIKPYPLTPVLKDVSYMVVRLIWSKSIVHRPADPHAFHTSSGGERM